MSAPRSAPASPAAGEGGGGKAAKFRMPRCVLEKWDADTLLFLFKCLGTGTTKLYPHPDHPDKPDKMLPLKGMLDPVVHGNYHPEGSKDRANETALYIRAMAKEEIAHAEADGEDARVKSLEKSSGADGGQAREGGWDGLVSHDPRPKQRQGILRN